MEDERLQRREEFEFTRELFSIGTSVLFGIQIISPQSTFFYAITLSFCYVDAKEICNLKVVGGKKWYMTSLVIFVKELDFFLGLSSMRIV